MADNSTRSVPTSGTTESIRTEDRGGAKTQVVLLDVGGTGGESIVGDVGVGLPVQPGPAGSSTDIALASSTTQAQVVASNTSRRRLVITNTDANRCFLKWGGAPTSSDWHFYLDSGERYEEPTSAIMTEELRAVWAADGSGSLIGFEA